MRSRAAPPGDDSERIRFDADDRGGVTVVVDGQPQSHVDLADPGLLAFDYVSHLALVLGSLPPGPLRVTHVGGAGMTLARWVEWARPGSPQVVLEPDAELTEAVRRRLPLPRGHRIRVRPVDGATGLRALRTASADAVVLDAYAAGRVPASLVTPAALAEVARVLAPDGVFVANLADEPGLPWVARFLATLIAVSSPGGLPGRGPGDTAARAPATRRSGAGPAYPAAHASPDPLLSSAPNVAERAFPEPVLIAAPEVIKSRRFGNVVVAASRVGLDLGGLARAVAGAPTPTTLRRPDEVARLTSSARPFSPSDVVSSPAPPDPGRWRVR